ncbi:methylenetetrahydrofolate reductase [NAD(P)H] [Oribacterium sp. HCP3S3_B9]|uniref:methylenetetrahydrofolate reductase [NAD(P)H] n=1 Tax=Oribacterium sp. HCP3S3_B9 TaxID=3438946 RepID=UPI003F8AAABE
MKIIDILKQDQITLSFEVFPPKKIEKYDSVQAATEGVAALHPSFMSVTYGAGGGTSEFTLNIAKNIRDKYGVEVLPHLTCVSSTKAHVHEMIQKFKEYGFENVMALRGDIPEGGAPYDDYHYASELVADIKSQGDFCIGGACYPDGHVECAHKDDDIRNLKRKVDAGVDFLTTQMFFDNAEFFNFLYRLREQDIRVPVLAGIMPITNQKQLGRSVALSGTTVPTRFKEIVDKFGEHPEAMKQAGIIYATEQIIDLIANDVKHIHVYSMNKPDVAEAIQRNLSEILKI